MKIKNISGSVQVLLVGDQKIKFDVNEKKAVDPVTGAFLVREFKGMLIKDEYITEVDKLLISEPVMKEGQELIQEEQPKKTRTKKKK